MKQAQVETNQGQKLAEDYEKEFKPINCIQNVSAYLLCKNDECTKFPFLCSNQKCKCHQQHPKCVKSTKKSVTIALEDKLVSYKNIENKIKEQIQKAIDQLSLFETQLLAECEKKFKGFVGLSEFEKDFMKAIKLGKVENITGKTIWNIQLNLKKSQKVTKMMETLEQDINKIWDQFSKDLQQLHLNITDRLELFECQLFEDSKLILTKKQQKIIQGFFESQQQKIKSAKLLFRASENSFSSGNFHNACNGHGQTITFCESTYGKKFGGYTPLAWNSNGTYYTDSTYKSFTFSIPNNHKLVPEASSTNHQQCNSSYGPTFGDGHDIYIADSCHQNFTSYSNINYRYKNGNYTNGSADSWKLFTGSQQNYNFKVKEYQVWKVQFT